MNTDKYDEMLQEIELEAAIYESVADPDHPMLLNVKTLLSTVREQRDLIEEQRRTIQSLMMGVEEHTGKDGTTPVLRYIEELEQQNADLPLRDKLKMAENLVEELQRQVQEADARRYKELRDMLLDTDFGLYVRVGEKWGPVTKIDELDSIIDDFAPKEQAHE